MFQKWLKEVDSKDDSEIIEVFNDIRLKLGVIAQGKSGKVTRFLVSTLGGFSGTLPGLSLGVFDFFILEKALPYSGVVAFIDKLYPSIFKKQKC